MKRLRYNGADDVPSSKALKSGERGVRFDVPPATSKDIWQKMIDDFRSHFSGEYM